MEGSQDTQAVEKAPKAPELTADEKRDLNVKRLKRLLDITSLIGQMQAVNNNVVAESWEKDLKGLVLGFTSPCFEALVADFEKEIDKIPLMS